MENKELIHRLRHLIQMDIDLIRVYDQAVKSVEHDGIQEELGEFQEDHDRRIRLLSDEVRKLGGEPPEYKADLKGLILEGFAVIRGLTGIEGTLKAVRGNERQVLQIIEDLLKKDLPEALKVMLERLQNEDQQHCRYIDHTLTTRLWEITPHAN